MTTRIISVFSKTKSLTAKVISLYVFQFISTILNLLIGKSIAINFNLEIFGDYAIITGIKDNPYFWNYWRSSAAVTMVISIFSQFIFEFVLLRKLLVPTKPFWV